MVPYNHSSMVQCLELVAKCCLNIEHFFIMNFIIVFNAQVQNIKILSSKCNIKSNAQKKMARFDFGCKFHDLNYVEHYP